MLKKTRGYVQDGHPFAVTSCGRRRNDGSPLSMRKTTKGAGRTFRTPEEGAGMMPEGSGMAPPIGTSEQEIFDYEGTNQEVMQGLNLDPASIPKNPAQGG